jgi:heterodisulfide reductase subunit C
MAIAISKKKEEKTLMDNVESISGVRIGECLQCKKCSNGCPVAVISGISPSEIIRRIQFSSDDVPFENDLIWMCVSCETCHERCPMKIDMAAVMDALRILAARKKGAQLKESVHLFNKSFLKTVRLFGRTYDLGMIAAYKAGTASYLQDTDKFPMLLGKRKIAFLPSLKGNRKYIKRIFSTKDKDNKQ